MKRGAEEQITKDSVEHEEESAPAVAGTFEKAPPEVLARRRILKVRRSLTSQPADGEATAANPFASLNPPGDAAPAGNGIAQEPSKPTAGDKVDPAKEVSKPEEKSADAPVQEQSKKPVELEKPSESEKETNLEVAEKESTKPETAPERKDADDSKQTESKADKNGPPDSKQPVSQNEAGKPDTAKPHSESEDAVEPKPAATTSELAKSDGDGEAAKLSVAENAESANETGKAEETAPKPASTGSNEEADGKVESEKSGEQKEEAPLSTDAKENAAVEEANDKSAPQTTETGTTKGTENTTAKEVNGGTTKPAFTFGSSAGAPALTFASAAAADNGSFNIKAAPAPPPTKPAPAKEFKEAPVQTGEEDERELFRARAKLYSLEVKDNVPRWRERGIGSLKVNKHNETGKVRMVMRTEATLRVVLNTPVFAEFKLDRATERSLRFQGYDVDDTEGQNRTSFLVRFSTREITSGLVEAIDKWKKSVESKDSK